MAGGQNPESPTLGRPTKYKPEYDEQARKLCLLGYTDAQIADFYEVDERTINNWKSDYPSFFQSLKNGKTIQDAEVAETLLNKALGKLTITEIKEDSSGKTTTEKQIAPDTTSIIFWLKNRQPELWRDKQEIHNTGLPENIMVVPEAKGLDDWEDAMKDHQESMSNG